MRKINKAVEGDLIAIPIESKWAIGRVVFVSEHFKEIMLFEIHGLIDAYENFEYGGTPCLSLYTASKGFKKRGWVVFGNVPVDQSEKAKTLRIVADDLWLEDKIVRRATKEDQSSIDEMYVDGHIRVENIIKRRLVT